MTEIAERSRLRRFSKIIDSAACDYPVVVAGSDRNAELAIRQFGLGRAYVFDSGVHTASQSVVEATRLGAVLVKGSVSTTLLARALLICHGADSRFVHVAMLHFSSIDRYVVLSDAGVNLEPVGGVQDFVADRAVEVARILGLTGGICLLGHSESSDDRVAANNRATLWSTRLRLRYGDQIEVAGPISLDLALSAYARSKKGAANLPKIDILLAPDIVVGNVLFKAVMLCGSLAAGIVVSSEVAVAVPSRIGSVREKAASLAIARLVTQARLRPAGEDFSSRKSKIDRLAIETRAARS